MYSHLKWMNPTATAFPKQQSINASLSFLQHSQAIRSKVMEARDFFTWK